MKIIAPGAAAGKKIPARRTPYFDIPELLAMMFASPIFAAAVKDHESRLASWQKTNRGIAVKERKLTDIVHSKGWKERFIDPMRLRNIYKAHNIAFALCVDGLSPFKGSPHTVTPVTLQILNLPFHLRSQFEYICSRHASFTEAVSPRIWTPSFCQSEISSRTCGNMAL